MRPTPARSRSVRAAFAAALISLAATAAPAQDNFEIAPLPPLNDPGSDDGIPPPEDWFPEPDADTPDAATPDAATPDAAAPAPEAGAADPETDAKPATGQRIKNPVAEFSGLDKITGRITSFDVAIDETVQFGALQVTPRVCYTSAPDEPSKTDAFVEVDEITLDREIRRIFTGWMFQDSPGLNAVEHPVYDVWLKSCKTDSAVPPPAG